MKIEDYTKIPDLEFPEQLRNASFIETIDAMKIDKSQRINVRLFQNLVSFYLFYCSNIPFAIYLVVFFGVTSGVTLRFMFSY